MFGQAAKQTFINVRKGSIIFPCNQNCQQIVSCEASTFLFLGRRSLTAFQIFCSVIFATFFCFAYFNISQTTCEGCDFKSNVNA